MRSASRTRMLSRPHHSRVWHVAAFCCANAPAAPPVLPINPHQLLPQALNPPHSGWAAHAIPPAHATLPLHQLAKQFKLLYSITDREIELKRSRCELDALELARAMEHGE